MEHLGARGPSHHRSGFVRACAPWSQRLHTRLSGRPQLQVVCREGLAQGQAEHRLVEARALGDLLACKRRRPNRDEEGEPGHRIHSTWHETGVASPFPMVPLIRTCYQHQPGAWSALLAAQLCGSVGWTGHPCPALSDHPPLLRDPL